MTTISKLIFTIAIVFAFSGTASAAEGLKIVVFDISRILSDTKAGKSIGSQVEKLQKGIQEDMSELQEEYKSKAEKLGEQRSLISADVLQSRAEELQVNARRDERKLASDAEAVRAGIAQAQKTLVETAMRGVDKIAKNRKADMVLRREAFFFATPSIDITKDVVAYVNKELPRVKVSPVKKN